MFIWHNGRIVKKEEAAISPFDHGFLYGIGLFETFRVYCGHCFLLDDHLARLNAGLNLLGIEKRIVREEAEQAVAGLLEANGWQDAYIRFNVSAGRGEIGLTAEPYRDPELLIFAKPLPPAGEIQEKIGKLLSLNRNTPEGGERLKSHHYMNNLLAWRELGGAPGVEGVFLTREGNVAEGIVSNVFWVRSGVLYTPSLDTGILNGITRQFIIELALRNGLSVEEGLYGKEDLVNAEEVFFTNSIQEIAACPSIGDSAFPGKDGEVAKMLYEKYSLFRHSLYSRNEMKSEESV